VNARQVIWLMKVAGDALKISPIHAKKLIAESTESVKLKREERSANVMKDIFITERHVSLLKR